ncbi:hypothetical protein, partial [Shewanella chilikensis]|uniref:hypothetical protein n=1 Tax=Shewanella chilikensis TaxID=558541 RepID=UPI00300785F6
LTHETDRRPVMQDQIMESKKGSAYLGNNAEWCTSELNSRLVGKRCFIFGFIVVIMLRLSICVIA